MRRGSLDLINLLRVGEISLSTLHWKAW
jgi:hypothetical protein